MTKQTLPSTRKPRSRRRSGPHAGSPEAQHERFYYKGNRDKQLRAFVATVRLGTVTRAAESLYLSQSSVSLQIKALERDLEVSLMQRHGRRLVVTDAGRALYDLARPLVEKWQSLDQRFKARLAGLESGELTIAAGTSTIQYLLPPLVQAFREAMPAVQLKLANVTGKDGLAMLRADDVDFAVGSLLDVPADMAWAPVYHFDPMLIMARDHPLAAKQDLALEDLSSHGLILPPERLTTYRQVDLVFQQHQVPYHVALEVGGWEVIKRYVAMGIGMSIVTSICLTEADREQLAVRNMRAWFPQRHYGVVMRKGKYVGPEGRAFMDLIKPGLLWHREYGETGHSAR